MNTDPGSGRARPWKWRPGVVDRTRSHFELRYGDISDEDWNLWPTVALVGWARVGRVAVEWLVPEDSVLGGEMHQEVERSLNFFLMEKAEVDPWAYLRHHCSTAANLYAMVHWRYVRGD